MMMVAVVVSEDGHDSSLQPAPPLPSVVSIESFYSSLKQ
jgi:hypothetical protein